MKSFRSYIDSLDESIKKEESKLIKIIGITRNPEIHTSISPNGDFLVHNRSFVAGRIEKGKGNESRKTLRIS